MTLEEAIAKVKEVLERLIKNDCDYINNYVKNYYRAPGQVLDGQYRAEKDNLSAISYKFSKSVEKNEIQSIDDLVCFLKKAQEFKEERIIYPNAGIHFLTAVGEKRVVGIGNQAIKAITKLIEEITEPSLQPQFK